MWKWLDSRFFWYCLWATAAWVVVSLWGVMQVGAVWRPHRARLSAFTFRVGEAPGFQSLDFSLPAPQDSICEPVGLTLFWEDSSLQIQETGGVVKFSHPENKDTIRFSIQKQAGQLCEDRTQLVFTSPTFLERTLPWWGAAFSLHAGDMNSEPQHAIELFHTPTEVIWFAPEEFLEVSLHLQLAVPDDTPLVSLPLLHSWWQGNPASEFCHNFVSVFFPQSSCSTGWWKIWQAPELQHENLAEYSSPTPGQVVISEVNWAGSFTDAANLSTDEWIELTNLSAEPVSLHGVSLAGAGVNGEALLIPSPLILAPYRQVVLSRLSATQSQLKDAPDLVLPAMRISNSNAHILLIAESGEILDQTPTGPWQVGVNQTSGHAQRASAQRWLNAPDGTQWAAWFDCVVISDTWCQAQSQNSLHFGAQKNWGSPRRLSPFIPN